MADPSGYPHRHVTMVLYKRLTRGSKYVRMPMNILKYGGAGRPIRTFLEPCGPLLYRLLNAADPAGVAEQFDAILTADGPPFLKSGV